MQQRLAAGVIVEDADRVLLVHHFRPGSYDFWVAPGGHVERDENLRAAARREFFKECGIDVEPKDLLYIEDLRQAEFRMCKFWFTGRVLAGALDTSHCEAARECIVEAAWLSRDELIDKTVYPPMLRSEYWEDRRPGAVLPKLIEPRVMHDYFA
jgi:ADP-ribose pyrophosphatase YjhB (NUDIX family)